MTFKEWLNKFPDKQYFEDGYGRIVSKERVVEYADCPADGKKQGLENHKIELYKDGGIQVLDSKFAGMPNHYWSPVNDDYVKKNQEQTEPLVL